MADGYRRFEFLKVVFSLMMFSMPLDSQTEGQQCMSSVKNTAVIDGQQDTIMGLSTNPQNVSWKVQPTSNETNTYTIIDYDGFRDTTLIRLYDVNQTGLIIKEATTVEYEYPISTAGLYIGQCANNPNRTGAKLLVVRKSPECSCAPINSTASTVSCKVTYADHSIQPIYPIVTWKLNGVFLASYTLQRTKVDAYVYYAESTIISYTDSPGDYTCELTFSAPTVTDIQFAYVATNAPEFNKSCSTSIVCGQKSTASPTTTTQPTTTRKLIITTNKELSTSATPPATTTQTPKTTQPSRTTATKILTAATHTSPPTSKSPTTATKAQTTTLRTLSTTSKQITQTSPKTSEPHITTPMKSRTATSLTTATTPKLSAVTADHFISTGSLTKNPINTAADAGSNNMTLECASIYGTNATRWSFIPLRSTTNETIWISSGYQLVKPYEHTYELNATVNSSILIVRQLSNLTEGTYSCYDGTESASALLLVIPFQISVDPLFGPIAGGTNITIIGSTTIIGYFSKYVDTNITGVRNVYIGKDFSSTSVSFLNTDSSTFEVVAVTPRTTLASIGQSLPIIIEFSPTPFNMSFNKFFVYLPNPVITGIDPNSFIVTGGTLIDVSGQSFSSVAKPIIQLTVVITRANENSPTSNTSTRICTVPPGNDTYMQCPMPPLNIPEDFLEILNSFYNASTSRKRRSSDPIHLISKSRSLLSRLKRDVNVLTVNGPNGIDRADIYLGFILDGYMEYENISDANLIFYSPPEINASIKLIEFDPSQEELIYVKGRYMMRGCRLRDYVVHIGNQICINSDLHDNQLSCRPPTVEPSPTVNDTIYCGQYLSISITIGYKQYQYACLKYADHSWRLGLIIGLTVGLAVFAFLLAILITVCIARRRRKKTNQKTHSHQLSAGPELRNRHEQPESQQNVNIIHKRQNTKTLYKPYDDYLPYGRAAQPDSRRVYDRQIHDTDDDIEPNFEYFATD